MGSQYLTYSPVWPPFVPSSSSTRQKFFHGKIPPLILLHGIPRTRIGGFPRIVLLPTAPQFNQTFLTGNRDVGTDLIGLPFAFRFGAFFCPL